MTDQSAREWEAALERLELQLNRAERMLTTLQSADLDLAMPSSLSTIPRYLMPRAQALLERQQRLLAELPGIVERAEHSGPLHERIGHLIVGPRPPVTRSFLEDAAG